MGKTCVQKFLVFKNKKSEPFHVISKTIWFKTDICKKIYMPYSILPTILKKVRIANQATLSQTKIIPYFVSMYISVQTWKVKSLVFFLNSKILLFLDYHWGENGQFCWMYGFTVFIYSIIYSKPRSIFTVNLHFTVNIEC